MTTIYINDGQPTDRWHGISSATLLRRCADARRLNMPDAAHAMAYVASLMDAGEPITATEFCDSEHALAAVERTLMDEFTGPVRLTRRGHIWAGHPALGYSQSPARRQENDHAR
jgi:hypothetical protein